MRDRRGFSCGIRSRVGAGQDSPGRGFPPCCHGTGNAGRSNSSRASPVQPQHRPTRTHFPPMQSIIKKFKNKDTDFPCIFFFQKFLWASGLTAGKHQPSISGSAREAARSDRSSGCVGGWARTGPSTGLGARSAVLSSRWVSEGLNLTLCLKTRGAGAGAGGRTAEHPTRERPREPCASSARRAPRLAGHAALRGSRRGGRSLRYLSKFCN